MGASDGRPLLALVMIVKDEAHTLGNTLLPLLPVIDAWYILDTGSTDGTQGIIRDTLRPVMPGNLLGIPAAVVPSGSAGGLPVGVQVMGDRFTDLRCLAIAEQIERATSPKTPIDPVLA